MITRPPRMGRASAWFFKWRHKLKGLESGLAPASFTDLQTAFTDIDPEPSRAALGYELGGLNEVLMATV